jgi:hypothetical protein
MLALVGALQESTESPGGLTYPSQRSPRRTHGPGDRNYVEADFLEAYAAERMALDPG